MRSLIPLIRTGFLTPAATFHLLQAKRKHKNNLCFLLKFAADRYGNKTALTNGHQSFTFRELYNTVLRLSFLIDKKINPEQTTTAILLCDNTPEQVFTLFAIQNLGIKLILVSHHIHPVELEKIIQRQPATCYVFTDRKNVAAENLIDIHQLTEEAKHTGTGEKFVTTFAKLIFPTSGTTGEPKMIEKRSGEMYWLQSFGDLLQKTKINQRKAVYISIPVSHGFGYTAMLFALILGKKAVISTTKEADELRQLIIKENTDLLVGVPASLNKLAAIFHQLDHPVKSVISGGAAMNEANFKQITATFGKQICSIYGSTEASVSFIANYDHLNKHSNALGVPFNGIQYKLLPLPAGGHELCIRSGLSNTTNDWLHTGDLAEENEDGSLNWCGRKDNMIIRNGVNIYPEEIESLLLKMPGIEDVLVNGKPDEKKGQIIVAVIQFKEGIRLSLDDIQRYLKQYLSAIKLPDELIESDGFGYTETGKKMKRAASI